jgi:hypothetical protein
MVGLNLSLRLEGEASDDRVEIASLVATDRFIALGLLEEEDDATLGSAGVDFLALGFLLPKRFSISFQINWTCVVVPLKAWYQEGGVIR